MNKYLLVYDAGYGEMADVGEFQDHDSAVEEAYNMWKEAAESNAEYRAELLTPELAEEHGVDYE